MILRNIIGNQYSNKNFKLLKFNLVLVFVFRCLNNVLLLSKYD